MSNARFLMTSMAAVLMLSVGDVTQGSALIDQNFDNTGVFVDGTILDSTGVGNSGTTDGLWKSSVFSAVGGTVNNDDSYSASQSIASIRTVFGEGITVGYVDTGATAGVVEASVRFRRQTTSSGADMRIGYNSDLASFAITSIGVDINNDGSLSVIDNTSSVLVLSSIDTGSTSWHGVKIILDIDAKTYDLYYSTDGTDGAYGLVYSDAVVPTLYSGGGSINAFEWGPNFNGGTVYFDDARLVTVIPEPASFGLAVLGAGIAMRRSRLNRMVK